MKEKVAWIWLHELKGLILSQKKQLLELYQTPLAIYNLPVESLQIRGVDSLALEYAEEIYEKSAQMGVEIFTLEDAHRAGFEASHKLWPLVIYYRGNPPNSHSVALIGTRDLSAMGYYFVEEILEKMRREDNNVYAGFASGVEKVALEGALIKKMPATAVLTHGLETCYPKRQLRLMGKLIEHGTLISPFPIGATPNKYAFVMRNQLLALMTKQTILVEASLTSNALSIAQWAHMYDRTVLTIKGPPKSVKCAGNNALLKSKIAMPIDVRLQQDISLHFYHKVAQRLKIEPMCFDQIIQTFGTEYPDITSLVLMLEHNRIVSLNSLGKWVYNGW